MTLEEITPHFDSEVTPSTRLRDIADSLELVQLCIDLEECTGMDIPDSDFLQLGTVQDVLNYVNQRSHAV